MTLKMDNCDIKADILRYKKNQLRQKVKTEIESQK